MGPCRVLIMKPKTLASGMLHKATTTKKIRGHSIASIHGSGSSEANVGVFACDVSISAVLVGARSPMRVDSMYTVTAFNNFQPRLWKNALMAWSGVHLLQALFVHKLSPGTTGPAINDGGVFL